MTRLDTTLDTTGPKASRMWAPLGRARPGGPGRPGFRLGWAVVALALLAPPVLAQDDKGPQSDRPTSDLRATVNLIPAEAAPDALAADLPFAYADIQGVLAAGGRDPAIAIEIMTGQTRPSVLQRLAVGMDSIGPMYLNAEHAAETIGFAWHQIGPTAEIGIPPQTIRILGGPGPADTDRVERALSARDFEREMLGGVPVWHQQEDMQINIRERDPTDPFWGDIGSASRIAMADGYLIGTRAWPAMRAAVLGTGDGLAAIQPYDAAVDALDRVLGENERLVQAIAFAPGAVADADTLARLTAMAAESAGSNDGALPTPATPRFTAALLVDAFGPSEDVALLALAHEDAALAEEAAARIVDAFARTRSLQVEESLGGLLRRIHEDPTVTAQVLPAGQGAVTVMRIAGPAFVGDEFNRFRNHGFALLVRALYTRDLGFLTRLHAP